jgi:hypothetical protein
MTATHRMSDAEFAAKWPWQLFENDGGPFNPNTKAVMSAGLKAAITERVRLARVKKATQ